MYGAIRAYGIDGKSKVKPINRYSGAIFDADIVEIGRGKSTVIYLVRLLASRAIDAKGKLFLPNLRSTLDLIDFLGGASKTISYYFKRWTAHLPAEK